MAKQVKKAKPVPQMPREIEEIDNPVFDLGFHIHHLLWGEPFFASISRQLRKVPVRGLPTLGVRYDEKIGEFVLAYNPDFCFMIVRDHGKETMRGILMHEFLHCILGHVSGRKPEEIDMRLWNVATDLAINGMDFMLPFFKDLKWKSLTTGQEARPLVPGQGQYENLQPGQASEWYLAKLPKDAGEGGQGADSGQGHGDHSGWCDGKDPSDGEGKDGNSPSAPGEGELDEATKEAMKNLAARKLEEAVQKAIDEANQETIEGGNGWGSVSRKYRKTIADAVKPKLNPKAVLRYFIKNSVRANKRTSITKINKRWSYIHPGRRWDRRAKIAISIDQSGSVGDEMLAKFFQWLNEFSKYASFTVIPFDHQVFEDKVYEWKQGESRKKERVLCGGTCFDAPTKYVNDRQFDGHIVITDMCAPKPKRSKCQRMWLTTQQCKNYKYFETNEKVLAVD